MDPFEEAARYEQLLSGTGAKMYKGYDQLKVQVLALYQRLKEMRYDQLPCHNDLVAANLVKDKDGRLYLIDWEYSQASTTPCLIWRPCFWRMIFSPEDEELFFHYYFGEGRSWPAAREKILIFKISQDFLWSIWTVLKEAKGDDFRKLWP